MALKVGELYAELRLTDTDFRKSLDAMKKLANSVTSQIGKDMQSGIKAGLKGITGEVNKATTEAANTAKKNMGNVFKGMNWKMDLGPLSSITTQFSALGAAGGAALGLIAAGVTKVKEGLDFAIQSGMAFEDQMATVGAVQFAGMDRSSTEVQANFKALSDAAKQAGLDTRYSATEAASALELMARAGFNTQQSIAALPGVLAAAAAEGMDLASASSIVSNVLRGFNLATGESTRVADVLAMTSAKTNSSIEGLGQSFKFAGPVASQLGLKLEDVAAALGLAANAGIQGTVSGRNLASGFSNLVAPTEKAKNVIDQLGLSFTKIGANGQKEFKQLPEIVGELQTKLAGLSGPDKVAALTAIFGKDNVKTWLALISQAPGELDKLSAGLQNSSGYAKDLADARMDSVAGQMKMLGSSAEGLGVAFYEVFQNDIKNAIKAIIPIVNSLSPVITDTFTTIRSVIISVAQNALPGLRSAWQSLAPAISSVVPALTTVSAVFVKIIGVAASWGSGIVAQVAKGMASAIAGIVAVLKQIGSIIRYWLQPHSPPKIVPDIDQYGADTAQLYVDSFSQGNPSGAFSDLRGKLLSQLDQTKSVVSEAGTETVREYVAAWSSADFSAFKDLAAPIEESIRGLSESGVIAKDAMVPAIEASRAAISQIIDEFKQYGDVSEESISKALSALGPMAPQVQGLVRSYINLKKASEEVARAQGELNRVTQEYSAKIAPLQGQLDEINKQKQQIEDTKRLADLQKTLADSKSTADEKALAQLEIQEIGIRQQMDAVNEEKDTAVDAAQAKLDAAEAAQKAAQAQYDAQAASMDQAKETNSLMREQVKILKDLADAQAKGSGGGGGGAGGLDLGGGGMGDMPDPATLMEDMLGPMTGVLGTVNEAFDSTNIKINQVQEAFNNATSGVDLFLLSISNAISPITNTSSALAPLYTGLQNIGIFITSTVIPPLAVLGNSIQTIIMPAIQRFGESIATTFGNNSAGTMEQFNGIMATLGTIVEQLRVPFMGLIALVGGTLLLAFQGILGIVSGALPGAFTVFQGVLQTINGIIQLVIGTITGLGTILGYGLSGNLEAAKGAFLNTFLAIQSGVGNIFSGLVQIVVGLAGTLLGGVAGVFDEMFIMATGTSQNMANQINVTMQTLVANVLGFAQGIYDGVIGWFQKLYDRAVGHSIIPDMANEIVAVFSTLVTDAVKFVNDLYTGAVKWFEDLKAKAVTLATELGTGVVTEISTLATKVTTSVSNLATDIGKLASSFLTEAQKIGSEVINGIIAGVKNGVGALKDAIKNAANSALDAAKKLLDINSPSHVFETVIGSGIMEGWALGITNGSHYVTGALKGVFDSSLKYAAMVKQSVIDAFGNVTEILKGNAELLKQELENIDIYESLLPNSDTIDKIQNSYDDVLGKIADGQSKIDDLQKSREESEKSHQERLAELRQKLLDNASDPNGEKASVAESRKKIQDLLAQLSKSTDPNDVLMQERIADLKKRDAILATKQETEAGKALSERAKIEQDIKKENEAYQEKLASLEKDRLETMREQVELAQQLNQLRNDMSRAQQQNATMQTMADTVKKVLAQSMQYIKPLQELDPTLAAKFFAAGQSGLDKVMKAQKALVDEQSKSKPDQNKLAILQQQLDLAKKVQQAEYAAFKSGELDTINKKIADTVTTVTESRKKLADLTKNKDLTTEERAKQTAELNTAITQATAQQGILKKELGIASGINFAYSQAVFDSIAKDYTTKAGTNMIAALPDVILKLLNSGSLNQPKQDDSSILSRLADLLTKLGNTSYNVTTYNSQATNPIDELRMLTALRNT